VDRDPGAAGEVPAAGVRLPRTAADRDPPGGPGPLERATSEAGAGPFGRPAVGVERLCGRKQRADRALRPLTISWKRYYARRTATGGQGRRYATDRRSTGRSGAGGARLSAGADASVEQLHELRDLLHDHLGSRRLLHELLLRVGWGRPGGNCLGL